MIERTYNIFKELLHSLLSIFKILLRSSFLLKHHKGQSEEVVIIGNGPSVNNVFLDHLDFLRNNTSLCVNGFPLSEYYEKIKPEYYIICSPGYYNQKAVDYNVEVRKEIIQQLISKTSWSVYFFLPQAARKNSQFIDAIKKNKYINIIYYNTTPVEGSACIKHILYRMGLGGPRPHNVLVPSILQMLNSRYKKIYLLGADHSWLPQLSVNDNNEVLLNQKHFYDEKKSTPKPMHKNEGRENRLLHEVLHKFYISFKNYHDLNEYAKSRGAQIINLTEESFIDAFPRKKLKECL